MSVDVWLNVDHDVYIYFSLLFVEIFRFRGLVSNFVFRKLLMYSEKLNITYEFVYEFIRKFGRDMYLFGNSVS